MFSRGENWYGPETSRYPGRSTGSSAYPNLTVPYYAGQRSQRTEGYAASTPHRSYAQGEADAYAGAYDDAGAQYGGRFSRVYDDQGGNYYGLGKNGYEAQAANGDYYDQAAGGYNGASAAGYYDPRAADYYGPAAANGYDQQGVYGQGDGAQYAGGNDQGYAQQYNYETQQDGGGYVYYDQYAQPVQYDAQGNPYDYYGQPIHYDYYNQPIPNYYAQQQQLEQQYAFPQTEAPLQQEAKPTSAGATEKDKTGLPMYAIEEAKPQVWSGPAKAASQIQGVSSEAEAKSGRRGELYIEATVPKSRIKDKKKRSKTKRSSDADNKKGFLVEKLLPTVPVSPSAGAHTCPAPYSASASARSPGFPGSEVIVYPSQYPDWISSVVAASAMDAEKTTLMPTTVVHTPPTGATSRATFPSHTCITENPSRLWSFKRRAQTRSGTPQARRPVTAVVEVPQYPRPVSIVQVPPYPRATKGAGPGSSNRRFEVIPVMHTAPVATASSHPAAHRVVLSGLQGIPGSGRQSCFPRFRDPKGSRQNEIFVRPFVQTVPPGTTVAVGKPRIVEVSQAPCTAEERQAAAKPTTVRFVDPFTHETTARVKVLADQHTGPAARRYNVMVDGKNLRSFVHPQQFMNSPPAATCSPQNIHHQAVQVAPVSRPALVQNVYAFPQYDQRSSPTERPLYVVTPVDRVAGAPQGVNLQPQRSLTQPMQMPIRTLQVTH